jgi:hypothetical protein
MLPIINTVILGLFRVNNILHIIDINTNKWKKTFQHLANDESNQFTIAYTKSLPNRLVNKKYTPLELFNILFYPNRYIITLRARHVIRKAIVYGPVILLKRKNYHCSVNTAINI